MKKYITPNYFLNIGGVVLLALGILGFITWGAGILTENSLFYLDNGENVAHTVLGIAALVLARVLPDNGALQKYLVVVVGLVALFFGVYGFAVAGNSATMMGEKFNTFGVANLENPLDNLLHLVVGAWAFVSAFWSQAPKTA